MAIKDDVKSLLSKKGITLTRVVDELNAINKESTTVQNLSNKLNRGTIKYNEVVEILSIIGYQVEWKPIDFVEMSMKYPSVPNRYESDICKSYAQIKYDTISESPEEYLIEEKLEKYIDESMKEVFEKIVKLTNELMNKKGDK